MSLRLKAGIFCLCAFSFFCLAQADTLHFKDGRSLEGIVKAKKNDAIEVEVSGGVVKYRSDDIAWIVESTDGVRRQLREKWGRGKASGEKSAGVKYQGEDFRPKEVKFIPGQQGMTVQATLNGKINVKLILDTGASLVVLRSAMANELGIDATDIKPDIKIIFADGRQSGAKHIVLRSLRFEEVEAENVEAAILVDESKDASLGDGLLGMSFLKNFNFKIDQQKNKLILEKIL